MKALTIVSLVLCAVCSALATNWRVPQDFAQVSVALEAAEAGDTILVSPGSYDEGQELWVFPENVTVKGIGSSPAEVVYLISSEQSWESSVILRSNCRLENLTIDSVRADTLCAIRPDSTGVVIKNVVFNMRRYYGIQGYGNVEVEISNVTFRTEGNFSKPQIGIWANDFSSFTIRNCLFQGIDEGCNHGADVTFYEFHNCFDNVTTPFSHKDPDPTDIIGPSGVGGWPYVPPYGSIVIDAGDPSGYDPDGTLPDIGAMRYNQTSHLIGFGETAPARLPGIGIGDTPKIFRAGDVCTLQSVITKPVGYPVPDFNEQVDVFLILDVYGDLWFWPSWRYGEPDSLKIDLIDGYYRSEEVFSFIWPTVGGSASGLRFWAATLKMTPEESQLGPIACLEFGYE